MITLHKSRIPVWIEALDGNTVDKTSFSRTIDAFLKQVEESDGLRCFVADSALYTKKTIGELSEKVQWVTRVPETVGLLKKLLDEIPAESFVSDPERPGYRWCELGSTFRGVRQRWVVVFSQSARDREAKTLDRKGFFVVATNALDDTRLSGRDLLDLYKAQGTSIELGFRFLKDPLFFADAFFRKSEKRIMALTMVMAIALLIYALAEEELRETLKKLRESLPDQKKKPTSRPTMRWIFQLMDNIHWKPSRGDPGGEVWMKDVQRKIVSFFSPEVRKIYGVG
jgi:transposase